MFHWYGITFNWSIQYFRFTRILHFLWGCINSYVFNYWSMRSSRGEDSSVILFLFLHISWICINVIKYFLYLLHYRIYRLFNSIKLRDWFRDAEDFIFMFLSTSPLPAFLNLHKFLCFFLFFSSSFLLACMYAGVCVLCVMKRVDCYSPDSHLTTENSSN